MFEVFGSEHAQVGALGEVLAQQVVAAVIGLGLNTSAYLSEVFRGAILGVDKGQWEASEALAMTWVGMMRHT
ncbi:MAG: polar amino acid transporter inner rane subunit, partial [Mycobacterium sp.]|nr:polar amino acid transporter inner rane subunit [Mycobacterium sp.]